jgi:hypothetical protein
MAAGCRGARGAVFRAAAREGWRRSNGPSATGAKAAPEKIVLTVKLLYVVSARVFNTKHSSSGGSAQVFFAPQEASPKSTRKQRANRGFANDHRSLHRVSTVLSTVARRAGATDGRVGGPLQFCHTCRTVWMTPNATAACRMHHARIACARAATRAAFPCIEANCRAMYSRRTMTGTTVVDCACRSTELHDAALRRQPVVPLR